MTDKIIRFPGAGPKSAATPAAPATPAIGPDGMSDEQRKAIGIIVSGMPFVLVGIKGTDRGADFFTAVAGEPSDLRNALPHLAGVIERAFERKGLA